MGSGVVEPARSEAVLFAWLTIVTALVCTPGQMRPELSTPHLRDHRGGLLFSLAFGCTSREGPARTPTPSR